ncbi:hypothetical protein BGW37DRAFT_284277 [Umbelopsis sp. PMI_123]|nr:hypothetical protein BGW37DRAFT_284277 [Umbelopsis sp. PMI_123]
MSVITSPIPTVFDTNASDKTTTLKCQWEQCSKPFPDHTALSAHLSEDHIGWKQPDYHCLWEGCARSSIKSHSRFALMMHLRTHTGEKPHSCTHPGCLQSFSRTDAMLKHRKTEHQQSQEEGQNGNNRTTKEKSALAKHKANYLNKERRPIDMSEASNIEGTENFVQRYKVVKTKLNHILRENTALNEEYLEATKRLKRLRTERRVLLDVLAEAEKSSQENKPAAETEAKPEASAAPQEIKEDEADDEEEEEEIDELMDEDDG